MSLCVVEPALIAKQPRESGMSPEYLVLPIESGRNSDGYPEMVNRLLYLVPESETWN